MNSSLAEMQNDASLSYCHSDLSLELKQALDKLQSDEKDIVLLCLVAGFTSKECSKIVGIKAVKCQVKAFKKPCENEKLFGVMLYEKK